MLKAPGIKVNEKTKLGSSPVMVAAKYCRKEALAGLIGDRRVDLDTRDSGGRRVEEVVAVAVTSADQVDKTDIMDYVARERLGRVEEEGRRDSMEEESIDVDDMHKLRVYSQVKELLGELRGLHQMDRVKLIAEQEAESHQFVGLSVCQFHVICEPCTERVRTPQLSAVVLCPTCKTSPFIGRNLDPVSW